MLNIILVAFVAIMAWWWMSQGLFSGFIHLVLTILSGAIALALWEPLVMGFLIDRMPEAAWGMGLIGPFAILLLGLRWIADTFVPGNLNFPPIVDMIGGGVSGFASAVLTTGILVIGLQMIGLPDLAGYKPFKIADSGDQLNAQDALWMPVDIFTANFFAKLSAGSLSPGDNALHRLHPDLAVEAAFFHVDPTPVPGRRALGPASGRVVATDCFSLTDLPPSLAAKNIPGENRRTIFVTTEIDANHPDAGVPGAGDSDSVTRISRQQVALLYTNKDGFTHVAFPIGFAQKREYKSLANGDFANSEPAQSTVITWVFQAPLDAKPQHIRVKSLRMEIPDTALSNDVVAAETRVNYVPPAVVGSTGPKEPLDKLVVVSDRLPFALDKNKLSLTGDLVYNEDAIVTGTGTGVRDPIVADNIRVSRVNHSANANIVSVNLGKRGQAQSLYGQIMALATAVSQPPILVDTEGRKYFAIGYSIDNGANIRFSFDPGKPIRSIIELDLGKMVDGDHLVLYYQVPLGATLVRFDLGPTDSREIPGGIMVGK